tara:strand:- start:2184 stop:3581 length:1398 start_codon:yes stop_codon:yes gene_type:complete
MGKMVGVPRFYIDIPSFLYNVGYSRFYDTSNFGGYKLLNMNPAEQKLSKVDNDYLTTNGWFTINKFGKEQFHRTSYPINFMAILNHNFAYLTANKETALEFGSQFQPGSSPVTIWAKRQRASQNDPANEIGFENTHNILNAFPTNEAGGDAASISPEWNGTSIFEFDEIDGVWSAFGIGLSKGSSQEDGLWYNGLEGDLTYFTEGFENDFGQGLGCGSIVVGRYYDCPSSPDLSLSMERNFDGIKTTKTLGGKNLTNIYYDSPTEWTMNGVRGYPDEGEADPSVGFDKNVFQYPQFELDYPSGSSATSQNGEYDERGAGYYKHRAKSGLGRKGLRTWDLTFSYISDDDAFMAFEASAAPFYINATHSSVTQGRLSDGEIPTDNGRKVSSYGSADEGKTNPMLADNSFNFVVNCTLGGTLPFIFQPDNTNNNPDQFAICKFKDGSYKVEQIAYNAYRVKLTIEEVA